MVRANGRDVGAPKVLVKNVLSQRHAILMSDDHVVFTRGRQHILYTISTQQERPIDGGAPIALSHDGSYLLQTMRHGPLHVLTRLDLRTNQRTQLGTYANPHFKQGPIDTKTDRMTAVVGTSGVFTIRALDWTKDYAVWALLSPPLEPMAPEKDPLVMRHYDVQLYGFLDADTLIGCMDATWVRINVVPELEPVITKLGPKDTFEACPTSATLLKASKHVLFEQDQSLWVRSLDNANAHSEMLLDRHHVPRDPKHHDQRRYHTTPHGVFFTRPRMVYALHAIDDQGHARPLGRITSDYGRHGHNFFNIPDVQGPFEWGPNHMLIGIEEEWYVAAHSPDVPGTIKRLPNNPSQHRGLHPYFFWGKRLVMHSNVDRRTGIARRGTWYSVDADTPDRLDIMDVGQQYCLRALKHDRLLRCDSNTLSVLDGEGHVMLEHRIKGQIRAIHHDTQRDELILGIRASHERHYNVRVIPLDGSDPCDLARLNVVDQGGRTRWPERLQTLGPNHLLFCNGRGRYTRYPRSRDGVRSPLGLANAGHCWVVSQTHPSSRLDMVQWSRHFLANQRHLIADHTTLVALDDDGLSPFDLTQPLHDQPVWIRRPQHTHVWPTQQTHPWLRAFMMDPERQRLLFFDQRARPWILDYTTPHATPLRIAPSRSPIDPTQIFQRIRQLFWSPTGDDVIWVEHLPSADSKRVAAWRILAASVKGEDSESPRTLATLHHLAGLDPSRAGLFLNRMVVSDSGLYLSMPDTDTANIPKAFFIAWPSNHREVTPARIFPDQEGVVETVHEIRPLSSIRRF